MNALDFYRWFGDWADEVIYCVTALSVFIVAYLFAVLYRWQKNGKHIWKSEVPFWASIAILSLGLLLGSQLREKYKRKFTILQQKGLVQQVDMRTTIDPDPISAAGEILELKEFKASLTGSMTESVFAFMGNIRQNYSGLGEERNQHYGKAIDNKRENVHSPAFL